MKKLQVVVPEKIGHIAPEIYGHFAEHIGGVIYDGLWVGKDSDIPNIRGFRKDLIEKLKEINPPVLRWPGGCFAEIYDWRDGIGENRPVRTGWWTRFDGRYESNQVGTHEFFDLCDILGCKSYLAINVTSVNILQARDWIDYCWSPRGSTTLALEREKNGHPEPFKIDYLGIGNENWGGGGNMEPEYFALQYRKFATLLTNICDADPTRSPKIVVGGADGADYNWTHKIMETISRGIVRSEGMSFHYYCNQGGKADEYSKDEWYTIIHNANRMEELLKRHYAIVEGYGMQNRAQLVIDEWGCWHPEGSGPSKGANLFEQQSTMRDAVIAALTLNLFNNYSDTIMMANVAQVVNNLHSLFLAGGENCITTPNYHVFDMYKEHQDADALRVLISNNDDEKTRLSASASVKGNKLTLTMANLSCDEDIDVDISLLGCTQAAEKCAVTMLSNEDMCAHNTFENPNKVVPTYGETDITKPFTVPSASVVKISVDILQ